MKAFMGLNMVAVILLVVSLLNIHSFRINMSQQTSAWRLTRIAMTHAHLMASEQQQDEIGVVDPSALEALESLGYDVSFALYDPEKEEIVAGQDFYSIHVAGALGDDLTPDQLDGLFSLNWEAGRMPFVVRDGMGMPRNSVGYGKINLTVPNYPGLGEVSLELARYALPVVYGPERRYGLLLVALSAKGHPSQALEEEWFQVYRDSYTGASEIFVEEWGEG